MATTTVGKCVECRRLFTSTAANKGSLLVAGRQFAVEICDDCRRERERHQDRARVEAAGRFDGLTA